MIAVSDSVKSIVTTRLEFWTTESADISGSAVAANANAKASVRDAVDLFIGESSAWLLMVIERKALLPDFWN
jgi:hypothetical protein